MAYQKMTHCHLYKYEFVQDHLKVFQKLSLLLTYLFKCLNEFIAQFMFCKLAILISLYDGIVQSKYFASLSVSFSTFVHI